MKNNDRTLAKLQFALRSIDGIGHAYVPDSNGPFAAIIVLHGSEGGWSGWSDLMCLIFAMHGFLAVPYRYSRGGNAWNAGDIIDVDVYETCEVINSVRRCELCTGWVGLYGASRGGEHALLAGWLSARDSVSGIPDAIAVHSPADVVCGAFRGACWRDNGDPGWRSWDPSERAWAWMGSSDALLPTTPIEIEIYTGPLFISHGENDEVWSVEMSHRLAARVIKVGGAVELKIYSKQKHKLDEEAFQEHCLDVVLFFGKHSIR